MKYVYIVWGKQYSFNYEIKLTVCNSGRYALTWMKRNKKYYNNMHVIRKQIGE